MYKLPRRIVVVGTTGSGKTTMASQLATMLGYPHIEMDALFWGPGWSGATLPELRSRVESVISSDIWVVDGNYGLVRDLIWPRVELAVWLDFSLPLILWRLTRRTVRRNLTREELWNGNRDRFWEHFTRRGLFYWAVSTHHRRRRQFVELLAGRNYPEVNIVRLRNPHEAREWLRHFAEGR